MMRLPFDSDGAREVNRCIFETIYYGALSASMEIAKRDGPYETYSVSPTALLVNITAIAPVARAPSRTITHVRASARLPALQSVELAAAVAGLAGEPGDPPVRHVGRHALVGPLGLGGTQARDRGTRRAQLAARRAHAHRLHLAGQRHSHLVNMRACTGKVAYSRVPPPF